MLTAGQERGKKLVEEGRNCLITGPGGVGKTFLSREITTNETLLCAPTGAAAVQMGGVTAASLFSLPLGVCLEEDKYKPAHKAQEIFANGYVKRILLDEISMVRADALGLIDTKLRMITRKDEPFGGVQMVFVGDFFQLPAVLTKKEEKVFSKMYDSPWAFDTLSWHLSEVNVVNLDEVMRQEDAKQIRILQSIRTKDKFWSHAVERINQISLDRPRDAIWLCSYNKTAWSLNQDRYREVKGKEQVFTAINKGFKDNEKIVDDILKLKVGCRVLIKANDPQAGYVNGTQGYVVDFTDKGVLVETSDGEEVLVKPFKWSKFDYVAGMHGLERIEVASYTQIPIKLGWAISIHGSQGCTLDSANIDFGFGAFAAGQAYVALSRAKDLTKVYIQNKLNYQDIIVDPSVVNFYKKMGAL